MKQARRTFNDETGGAIAKSSHRASFQILVLKVSSLRASREEGNERGGGGGRRRKKREDNAQRRCQGERGGRRDKKSSSFKRILLPKRALRTSLQLLLPFIFRC